MTGYASALSIHPNSFEAAAECAGQILEQLGGERPDLAVVFASAHHLDRFADLSAGLRKLLEADVLIGATTSAVAGGHQEVEDGPGLSVFAADWGGGHARGIALDSAPTGDGFRIDGWPDDVRPDGTLLLLADPMSFPVADFLHISNENFAGLQVIGGVASTPPRGFTMPEMSGPVRCVLALDDSVRERGAVGVVLDPSIPVRTVVSQGCRPIGQPFTITSAHRNVIQELAGRPPLARLRDIIGSLDEADHDLVRHGLHVGIVIDEHASDFGRGDFLVRNLVGADESTGSLAIGEIVDVGQTVQFHVRDRASADADLAALLADVDGRAALLFTCTGRGKHLFGTADHDAQLLQDRLGSAAIAGMFCSGEIGPIGGQTFLHGYTASVAVFG